MYKILYIHRHCSKNVKKGTDLSFVISLIDVTLQFTCIYLIALDLIKDRGLNEKVICKCLEIVSTRSRTTNNKFLFIVINCCWNYWIFNHKNFKRLSTDDLSLWLKNVEVRLQVYEFKVFTRSSYKYEPTKCRNCHHSWNK